MNRDAAIALGVLVLGWYLTRSNAGASMPIAASLRELDELPADPFVVPASAVEPVIDGTSIALVAPAAATAARGMQPGAVGAWNDFTRFDEVGYVWTGQEALWG